MDNNRYNVEATDELGNHVIRTINSDGTLDQRETYVDGSTRAIATDPSGNKLIIDTAVDGTINQRESYIDGTSREMNIYTGGDVRRTDTSFDTSGNLISESTHYEKPTGYEISHVSVSYDDNNNQVIKEVYNGSRTPGIRTVTTSYDNNGNKIVEDYYKGTEGETPRLTTTTYVGDSDEVASTSRTITNNNGETITSSTVGNTTTTTLKTVSPNGRGTSTITEVSVPGESSTVETVNQYNDHTLTIKEEKGANGVTSSRVRTYTNKDGVDTKTTTTSFETNSRKVASTRVEQLHSDGTSSVTTIRGNRTTTEVYGSDNQPIQTTVTTVNNNGTRNVVQTSYDSNGRPTTDRFIEDGIVTKNEGRTTTTVSYTGNKISETTVDEAGTITSVKETSGGSQGAREVITRYDSEGNAISKEVTSFTSRGTTVTVYGTNAEGKDETIYSVLKDSDGNTSYYDKDGNEIDLTTVKDNPESNLARYSSEHKSDSKGTTISSNLSYVNNQMDDLQSRISTNESLSYTGGTGSLGSSEAPVVGAVYDASNYYTNITNNLYSKLSGEISTVKTIAQAMYDMDQNASSVAENNLTDGSNLNVLSSSNYSTQLVALNANMQDLAVSSAQEASRNFNSLADKLESIVSNGNVGFVSKDALTSAVNNILPILQGESDRASAMQSNINDFISGIGGDNILQGDVWENVRTNMDQYNNLLECNKEAASFLSETIKTAMGLIVDLMDQEGLTEIDDKNYPEYCERLAQALIDIDNLTSTIAYMKAIQHTVYTYDSLGHVTGSYLDPSDADIAAQQTLLDEAIDIKEDCEHWKGVYEELASRVQAAQELMSDSVGKIRATYNNPTEVLQGNIDFPNNFNIDLSAYSGYGIDPNSNYPAKVTPATPIDPESTTDKAGASNTSPTVVDTPTPTDTTDDGYYGDGGYPGGGGVTDPVGGTTPNTPETTPNPTPTYTVPTYTMPTLATPTPTSTEDDSVTRRAAEEEARKRASQRTQTQSTTDSGSQDAADAARRKVTSTGVAASGGSGATVTSADGVTKLGVKRGEGGVNYRPYTETNPNEDAIVDDFVFEELPNEEMPVVDDYSEFAPSDQLIDTSDIVTEPIPETKENKTVKTLGIAAGVGLAVGASALGAHTMMTSNEDDKVEEEEDYGYDK